LSPVRSWELPQAGHGSHVWLLMVANTRT